MRPDQPLTFRPLYMERVWGGRRLAEKFGRPLPAGAPIGESWELVDREDAQSVVESGPLAGKTLHELWTTLRSPIFGRVADSPRFPLLAKILDARETLSVQVHPPARIAAELKGEPKSEMWFLLESEPGAELFAGFRRGTTRAQFETALAEGHAADLLHRLPVRAGDAIFIPGGRCHAIGAGCFLVEMQQNSDTTYRIFDWNRVGLDGKPRPLHLRESLLSIDFADHEPSLAHRDGETVVACEHFKIEHWTLDRAKTDASENCAIFTVLGGSLVCGGRTFKAGDFFLLPASATNRTLAPSQPSTRVLRTTLQCITAQACADT